MRILLTGARGMVGSSLVTQLKHHEVIAPTKAECNITRLNQVMKFKADFIIHLAAETDHEYCEENPAQCYLVNTIGTGNMTRLAQSLQVPIIYLSTASIFDGKKQSPYEFFDQPNPLNHYNISKYYGEVLCSKYSKHIILRAGWMFGGGPNVDKKFVNKIMNKLENTSLIRVANDCFGSPTYANDLAKAISIICSEDVFHHYGTYNCCNEKGGVSRYEFAQEMMKILNKDGRILPCMIDNLKEEFPCKRTNYEVLADDLIMRPWQEALKEYLDAYYRH